MYYGGGGQGNHLPGAYARGVTQTLGMKYRSNALAQEKTGVCWVQGHLFGRQNLGAMPDFQHTDCAVFVGKNPWQSHGFPETRNELNRMKNDDTRSIIVMDPRVTETAAIADHHLRVRPGTDAWLLSAMLAGLVACAAIPDCIDTDHPDRFRAMIVESANPLHTLPACSQYEKPEATFFAGETPANHFHLRQPIFEPLGESLPQAEIHSKLVEAMGGIPEGIDELKEAALGSREEFIETLGRVSQTNPDIGAKLPTVLYRTLGQSLEGDATSAILFGASKAKAWDWPTICSTPSSTQSQGSLSRSATTPRPGIASPTPRFTSSSTISSMSSNPCQLRNPHNAMIASTSCSRPANADPPPPTM